jgi:hypothetical protein
LRFVHTYSGRGLAGANRAGDAAELLEPADGAQGRGQVDQAPHGQVHALADDVDLDEDGLGRHATLERSLAVGGLGVGSHGGGVHVRGVQGVGQLAGDLGRRGAHHRRAACGVPEGRDEFDGVGEAGGGFTLDRGHLEVAGLDGEYVVVQEGHHADVRHADVALCDGLRVGDDPGRFAPGGPEGGGGVGRAAEGRGGVGDGGAASAKQFELLPGDRLQVVPFVEDQLVHRGVPLATEHGVPELEGRGDAVGGGQLLDGAGGQAFGGAVPQLLQEPDDDLVAGGHQPGVRQGVQEGELDVRLAHSGRAGVQVAITPIGGTEPLNCMLDGGSLAGSKLFGLHVVRVLLSIYRYERVFPVDFLAKNLGGVLPTAILTGGTRCTRVAPGWH